MPRPSIAPLALSLLAAATPVQAQRAPESPGRLLVRDVTVVGVGDAPSRSGMDVLIVDSLIESVAPTRGEADFDGRVLDGRGAFLIPGIVDAHTHVEGSTREDANARLRWALEGGVTSIRDMAGDARDLAGLQRALIVGELTGPRLYYSALMAGPAFMSDPRLDRATVGYARGEAPYMIPLSPESDVVRAVAMAKGTGARGVKLYADLDPEVVAAVTREAHTQGLQVWAHSAIFPARPLEILDAGVDGVSHAPYVIWDAEPPTRDFTLRAQGDFARISPDGPAMGRVIEALVRNGTVLDPTLWVFARPTRDELRGARLEWASAFTKRAADAGVTLAAGTDGLGFPVAGELPNVHAEMELLVAAGLSPAQALTAGTLGGAMALGLQDRFGTVEAGKTADLVLLGVDPTREIRSTRRILRVIQGGRVVR